MADDEELKPHHATARPPPGEEDVYSASTVAGEASDEILAIIRGDSQRGFPSAPGVPKNLKVDPKSEPKIELKSDAKAEVNASDLMPTRPPPANMGRPGSKLAYGSTTPLEVPVTSLTPTSEPPASVEIAPDPEPEPTEVKPKAKVASAPPEATADAGALATDETPNFKKGALHPAVGIVLFFVAVLAVLAALIR